LKEVRVVIIGSGGISYQHAAACQALPDVELVAVCDTKAEAAERLGAQFGVTGRYGSLDQLLERESADLVIVATWGSTHAEVCGRLARSGKVKAILCEKPLATDAAEAAEMFRVARESGVMLAEAFRLRHQPIHHRVRELIDEGRIGEVRHVRNVMASHHPPETRRPELNWRFNKPAGGGVTYDIGCYAINQARWAVGAEPEVVHAVGVWGEVSQVDEHVVAHAQFPGGVTAEWCVSWQAGPAHMAEVFGTKGRIRLERAWGIDQQGATTLEIFDAGGRVEVLPFPPVKQFELQLSHYKDVLETGRPHRIPPEDSIRQMRVIDAVYESLRTGQAAAVPRD
jgi:D-xylose 1-dehydrogenase (NADP+, D-xylono-1,5-lactone-forming)